MKIQSGSSGVVLTPKEKSPDGSIRVSVSVNVDGFTGVNRRVWFSPYTLSTFIENLRSVCDRRSGEAVIEALSPTDLRLVIRIIDLAGHASCLVNLANSRPAYGRWTTNSISVEFEIDPSLLPAYLNDAEKIGQINE